MKKFLFCILIFFFCAAHAELSSQASTPADRAFSLTATGDAKTLFFVWQIAPGMHLYKEHFKFKVENPSTAQLGRINYPRGIPHHDEFLGDYEVYQNQVKINVHYVNSGTAPLNLLVQYQGCSGAEICFPPIKKRVIVTPNNTLQPTITIEDGSLPVKTSPIATPSSTSSAPDKATQLLAQHNIFLICAGFFGFGLLLAFTPCVLPMIPILSGIIIGHGKHISAGKAFILSLIYVLSMSFTYAIAGIFAGLAGNTLQASLQNPWVIGIFSAFFVVLALSLFGLFDIQLPHGMQQRIANVNHRQKGGSYIGVAIMGCLATLIVSPCVSAPLVAALAYMGQTGNALISGIALFTMGLGMGFPLIILGATSAKLLPKAGHWMYGVKIFSGVLLLATAIWMLQRIIPGPLTLFLWACLLIVCGMYMGAWSFNNTHHNHSGWYKLGRGFGYIAFIYGAILIIGAAMGRTDPFAPLATEFPSKSTVSTEASFQQITSLDALKNKLSQSKNKLTILDFYADWCMSCKRMVSTTFADPNVKALLANTQLLQANVTNNNAALQTLAQHFKVIGPPTILFFDANGKEMPNLRIVGEISAEEFAKRLQSALQEVSVSRSNWSVIPRLIRKI